MVRNGPNVIVVLVDQLRAFEVGCYGNGVVRTPHVDRMAREGMRFETAVTNNPVCTAARSCLISGQYSRTCTGEIGNVAGEPARGRRRLRDATVAECFRGAGYRTGLIGKWHVDADPRLVGFEEAYYPLNLHRYVGQRYFDNGVLGAAVEGYSPEHEREKVDAFLEGHKEERFFLYYNISLPHMPIGAVDLPGRYAKAYSPGEMVVRGNAFRDGVMAHSDNWFKIYTIYDYFMRTLNMPLVNAPELGYPAYNSGELPTDVLPAGFDLRNLYALYYGATTWVDDLVGAMMGSLRRHGLGENTVVVFLSDHGDNLGSHGLFNKGCLYEESIRVPCVFWGPGVAAGRVNRGQVASLIDVMPTLLDLCGLEIPRMVQGQSLAGVVRGESETAGRSEAFIETDQHHFGRPTVGIRTLTRMYGAFTNGKGGELAERWGMYRVDEDLLEERDVGDGAEAGELRGRLREWHEGTGWGNSNDE